MTLPALTTYPAVDADWDVLSDAAADLRTASKDAHESMADASSSWRGFRTWYRHDDTEDAVWTGLDALEPHAEDWASALSSAKDAIDDFVATGKPLQDERESLDRAEPGLSSRRSSALSSDDEALVEEVRQDIVAFNERATQLKTDWDNAQETFETAIGAISLGTTDGLPIVSAARDEDTQILDWAGMTSELDERFGEIDPKSIWRDLRGLDEDELRDWLLANPEAARALAENELPDRPVPGSAEETITEAMADDAHLTEEGIAGIREAWLDLEDHERERLMLLYPAIIGNLNGIPLATRGRTNQITVAGLREQTAEKLAEHSDAKPQASDFPGPGNRLDYQIALDDWEAEGERLETVHEGLTKAWAAYGRPHSPEDVRGEPGYDTLFVSTEGNGQIATMRGTPSAATGNLAVFVPGTGTTIDRVDQYNLDLDAIDGDDPEGTVSIYWQGTDLPQSLLGDNATPKFNEQGAPRLAAFDYAADLEFGARSRTTDVRTTYIGHSAGGSLLGTAEREGLDSSAIVYVAPAGVGHEVGSPEDTANEHADRYWIQTRADPIWAAQGFGGSAHGPSGWEGSSPSRQMGAHRLESGFLRDGTDTLIGEDDGMTGGHTSYFTPGSDAALNIEGVVQGTQVFPYVEPEFHYGFGYSYTEEVIETNRAHYLENGLDSVPVGELED